MRLIEIPDDGIIRIPIFEGDATIGERRIDLSHLPTVEALPLRCRIGDEVWIVGTKCLSGVYEEECDVKCDDCHLDKEYMVFQRKVDPVLFLYLHDLDENNLFTYGKTVFLTREEAEAALAERKMNDAEQ